MCPVSLAKDHLPRCRKSGLQAGGGALCVEGKGGAAALGSAVRKAPKRSGWAWGWDSGSRGSKGSAVETGGGWEYQMGQGMSGALGAGLAGIPIRPGAYQC